MPELPEVETVCTSLRPNLVGKEVAKVVCRRSGLRYPFPKELTNLKGHTITKVWRRSKLAIIDFSNTHSIILHLGMSGRVFFLDTPTPPLQKHDHFSLYFTNGQELRLNDTRRFGFIDIWPTKTLGQSPHFKNLGPEPLEPNFTPTALYNAICTKSTEIKKVMMDNPTVVGIGNIYASEALFKAGIHPKTPAKSLCKQKVILLHQAIVTTLKQAIIAGGSSLKDYVHTDGSLGYFQHQFNVYGRHNKPCTICTSLIEKTTQAGRASFFCPRCQSIKNNKGSTTS